MMEAVTYTEICNELLSLLDDRNEVYARFQEGLGEYVFGYHQTNERRLRLEVLQHLKRLCDIWDARVRSQRELLHSLALG
jgi:hypothetical protein